MTPTPVQQRPWWLLPAGRVHVLWWFALLAAFTVIDASGGSYVDYPAAFFIPAMFAAWYSGRRAAVAVVAAATMLQGAVMAMAPPADLAAPIGMLLLRAVVIGFVAFWFARLEEYERQVERYVGELEGLLPICAICKSIRDESGEWQQLERFISARSRADFSHSVCPSCMRRHYPEP